MLKYTNSLICSCLCLMIFPLSSQTQEVADNQSHKFRGVVQASRHSSASQTFKKKKIFPRRPGVVIYKLKPFVAQSKRNKLKSLLAKHSATKIDMHPKLNLKFAHFPGKSKSEEELCVELMATGILEFCEPDYLVCPAFEPNDPKYFNTYLQKYTQWHHPKIGSPAAWDITVGVPEVKVGLCDSGIDSMHEDLKAIILLPGYNSVDGSQNTSDILGHGTKVAGCLNAVGNNSKGVAGMCWRTRIIPVRITNSTDGRAYHSDIAEGIRWAAANGARVINLSYRAGYSSTVNSAANYARTLGALTFVGAGNDAENINGWPDFSGFVLVGATDSDDFRTSISNYGTPIDVMAPGDFIYTTAACIDGGFACYSQGYGTSMASPITAGLAALIYSLNISFTPQQVEQFIFSTAIDMGDSSKYGHGRINAAAAVQKANSSLAVTVTPWITSTPEFTATAT
ncbi:S8 family serine peptidase, partial [bacterium]|nr:S8 family serine peptidase [bacterium]